MAVTVRHAFVSPVADRGNPDEVGPDEWNAEHVVDGALTGSTGSTDNRLLRADGTGGATVQATGITSDDTDNLLGVGGFVVGGTSKFATAHTGGPNTPNGQVLATDSSASFLVARFLAGAFGPRMYFAHSRSGTVGGYAATQSADELGTFSFAGSAASKGLHGASLVVTQTGSGGTDYVPAKFDFQTSDGTAAPATRMQVGGGLYHASATGGDKGNNTINFGAVYDDNTLLSCYPFDAYLDGEISFEKWDDKVADLVVPAVVDEDGNVVAPERIERRQHEDMRKFAARLGTEYDPLDIDKYTQHWKDKRHLSSLPNETKFDPVQGMPAGDWIQRLVETVEIQAIHIAQLNDRLKALEAK